MSGGLARRIAVDVTPIRVSRDFRHLELGGVVSALGSQAALVALPFEIFRVSHSATLVGLLGAFELGPMTVISLVGGAFLDRHDRRPILIGAQGLLVAVLLGLAALVLASGRPPVLALLLLGGLLAGASSLSQVAAAAIAPALLGPELLTSGMAFSFGAYQAASVVGPGLGGLLIGATGVGGVFLIDAASCLALVWAGLVIPAQPPVGGVGTPAYGAGDGDRVKGSPGAAPVPVRRAISEGLGFVARTRALAGSFVVDLNAMTFGMPRALFAVLALTVFHAGAGGTGLLYAAIAVGGTLSVLTSGWVAHARRLGRIVLWCVALWGLAIVGVGLVGSLAAAAGLLALAGWADGISAICRTTIAQSLTPEPMRGRMSAVYSLVVAGGPRLGDIESGLVAGLSGALASVWIGGAACVLGVGAVMVAYPELTAYDAEAVRARGEDAPRPPR
ncbi:MAG TPA: MFS transporter [Solirubrobacteraceae bacterium]|nr:MFS transporter [Solirubrobacteraceae bacterium]